VGVLSSLVHLLAMWLSLWVDKMEVWSSDVVLGICYV
jgi:hypothetical protein